MRIQEELQEEALSLIEELAYPPWEGKGILNFEDEPGSGVIWIHDPTVEDSFIRQVPPSPALIARAVAFLDKVTS